MEETFWKWWFERSRSGATPVGRSTPRNPYRRQGLISVCSGRPLGPASWVTELVSRVPDPASWFPELVSRVPDPASWFPEFVSRIPGPASWLPEIVSRVPGPASWLPGVVSCHREVVRPDKSIR